MAKRQAHPMFRILVRSTWRGSMAAHTLEIPRKFTGINNNHPRVSSPLSLSFSHNPNDLVPDSSFPCLALVPFSRGHFVGPGTSSYSLSCAGQVDLALLLFAHCSILYGRLSVDKKIPGSRASPNVCGLLCRRDAPSGAVSRLVWPRGGLLCVQGPSLG